MYVYMFIYKYVIMSICTYVYTYICIYVSATIYGDRRYEGLWAQRKGPGVNRTVLRPHFGPWNASRASWDALCATGTQLGRPEGSRRALQRGQSGLEGASKRLRGRSERLLGSILGQTFSLKIAFGGRPAQRPLRGAFFGLFRVGFRWHAQAPTCVSYCNLQYILGVAPSR